MFWDIIFSQIKKLIFEKIKIFIITTVVLVKMKMIMIQY